MHAGGPIKFATALRGRLAQRYHPSAKRDHLAVAMARLLAHRAPPHHGIDNLTLPACFNRGLLMEARQQAWRRQEAPGTVRPLSAVYFPSGDGITGTRRIKSRSMARRKRRFWKGESEHEQVNPRDVIRPAPDPGRLSFSPG